MVRSLSARRHRYNRLVTRRNRLAGSHGFSLVETLVAVALLGFTILMTAVVVTWSTRHEQRARQRAAGVELAATVAERLRVAPYAAVVSGEVDVGDLDTGALPDPVVTVEVEEDDDLGLKDVTIEVSWGGRLAGRLVLETAVGSLGLYR
jgi:type II secretory pathway pseudopilin PulG